MVFQTILSIWANVLKAMLQLMITILLICPLGWSLCRKANRTKNLLRKSSHLNAMNSTLRDRSSLTVSRGFTHRWQSNNSRTSFEYFTLRHFITVMDVAERSTLNQRFINKKKTMPPSTPALGRAPTVNTVASVRVSNSIDLVVEFFHSSKRCWI